MNVAIGWMDEWMNGWVGGSPLKSEWLVARSVGRVGCTFPVGIYIWVHW